MLTQTGALEASKDALHKVSGSTALPSAANNPGIVADRMTGILTAHVRQRIARPDEDHGSFDAPPWCEYTSRRGVEQSGSSSGS